MKMHRLHISLPGLLALAGLAATGCAKPQADANPPAAQAECIGCHGSAREDGTLSSAPPVDLMGETAKANRGVGAHEAHLGASKVAAPVACESCHVVPVDVYAPGHMDDPGWPADVVFGGVAVAGGAQPALEIPASSGTLKGDRQAPISCSSTYCHGATLTGGKATKPDWNRPWVTTFADCDSCHGNPPPAPHPAGAPFACAGCHGEVVAADGTIADKAKHIDGTLQVAGGSCNACHGSSDNAAPPKDTAGNTEPTALTVGAHQAHLKATAGRKVACSECHRLPTSTEAEGHLDGGPAEVKFGAVANADGATSSWDRSAATCATYCHGATLAGGSNTSPKWTRGSDEASCGSCHGLPPPSPHPEAAGLATCVGCHSATVDAAGAIAAADKHVDGQVQVSGSALTCNSCHGNADNSAPPRDTDGKTAVTEITVGAHQAHLKATLSKPVACAECHVVPATNDAAGHLDASPAELEFGALSEAGGATASWTRSSASCSNYCHGQKLTGGTKTSPKWTVVDGSQKACDACHGNPPKTGKHPGNFEDHDGLGCVACHAGASAGGPWLPTAATHVDGHKDVKLVGAGTWSASNKSCSVSGCHGTAEAKSW